MPNNQGIKTVIITTVSIAFLSLILLLNSFVTSPIHYLRVMGCAKGTICAASYANILMEKFEDTYIYPYIKRKAL